MISSVVIYLIYLTLNYMNILNGLLGYVFLILILQAFQSIFAQFVRAIGEIKIFALNGILTAFVTAGLNIIFIVFLRFGVKGYLLSILMANSISILYLTVSTKLYRYLRVDNFNLKLTKRMLIFSLPLIPNAFIWWVVNASNRYIIFLFLGTSHVGLFAVANKIPALLTIINSIFFQSWQMSAIEEFDSKHKSEFYSTVFHYFSTVMFLGTSFILIIFKYILEYAVSIEFYSAWELVPFLLLGVVFSSFSGFLGTNYIAAKETNGIFKTSVIGGIVNVLLNLLLVPSIGTNGAGISTTISFFVIWILRAYGTRQFIRMKINRKSLLINLILIHLQIIVLYLNLSLSKELIIELLLFASLIVVNKSIFIILMTKITENKWSIIARNS